MNHTLYLLDGKERDFLPTLPFYAYDCFLWLRNKDDPCPKLAVRRVAERQWREIADFPEWGQPPEIEAVRHVKFVRRQSDATPFAYTNANWTVLNTTYTAGRPLTAADIARIYTATTT